MIKTLILDFDGTLADTQACIVASVQSTLNVLRLPSVPQEEIISRIGLPLRTVLTEGAHIPTGTLLEKSVDIYRQLFDEISPRTAHLFPHVKETLTRLHDKGTTLAIASGKSRRVLLQMMKDFDLLPLTGTIVCDDHDLRRYLRKSQSGYSEIVQSRFPYRQLFSIISARFHEIKNFQHFNSDRNIVLHSI